MRKKKKILRHLPGAIVLHWLLALTVSVKAWTGFYISSPRKGLGLPTMDTARKMHLVLQFIFLPVLVIRAYHSYLTKDYKLLLPSWKDLRDLPRFLQYELFIKQKKPVYPKYNPGQKIYFAIWWFLLFPLMTLTGLIMYAPKRLQKLVPLLGGLNRVRHLHYLAAVALVAMAVQHVYLNLMEGKEKLKSIFTGWYRPE